ncbi:MAG: DNA repair protein RadA [Patescibacteria group bacterium]
MQKSKKIFSCSKCGAQFPKWQGQCGECGSWGTLSEEVVKNSNHKKETAGVGAGTVIDFSEINDDSKIARYQTGIEEFDRVVGGGIVSGSVVLLGGEPGIGKSTLILQIAEKINGPVLYISGEESAQQVKMRLDRLELNSSQIKFLGETDVEIIVATIKKNKPKLAIIDSIQTMYLDELDSESGAINQIKACTAKLIEVAKQENVALIIVGHVTKSGEVSGPKTLEHLVDTVLYLEGDKYHAYRILRSIKNRFGNTNEVGVFDMRTKGLIEVKNPSEIFLTQRKNKVSGTAITATLEGSRAFLVEIQALTSWTSFGYPQRKSVGVSLNRLQLLVAVLTKRCNLKLDKQDIHLNVVGGLDIDEPAVDLAVCMAVASANLDKPLDSETVFIGEVGLAGEVRLANQIAKRIKEAEKFGFKTAVIAKSPTVIKSSKIKIIQVDYLSEVIRDFLK